ncbi:hypothetical protein HPB51_012227 [Rhipicephalus microplus]|uniref:HTH CENPB-type domain-containing protein n=1 Tax=Rhipicephalus microplus TaxID=6941 RepID=A0A9J6E9A6_RHIMP|nr:hypothetical protein HPB51_012227 [Rhipicephalus microplus]
MKILTAFQNSYNNSQKNNSKGVHPALEHALQLWLKRVLAKNLPVSGDLLKGKADSFALKIGIEDFKFTGGWLRGFKKSCTILCLDNGKADKVDILAAIHMLAEARGDDLDVGDPDGTDGREDLLRDLCSGGVDVPATMTFKDFTRADDDIVLCAEPTDKDIHQRSGGDRHPGDAFVEHLW